MSGSGATTRGGVARLSQLDSSARSRLEAACGFINEEVSAVRRRLLWGGIVTAVVGAGVAVIAWNVGFVFFQIPLIVALFAFAFYASRQRSRLADTYKQVVIGRIVGALGNGLAYSPTVRFSKDDFRAMDLFLERVETWNAEDEVAGRRNAVAYAMFEAEGTRTEGSGKHRRTVTTFKGLIVRIDFNKHFQGHTIVVPNSDSQVLGGLFGESETRRRKELCRMENVTFEDTFSVYSTDQQEARYILTPKLMELILSAHESFGSIRCSFQESSMFLTIPSHQDRFEPRIFGAKMTPESAVAELVECVDLAERLIDTLDLETRIWSKV